MDIAGARPFPSPFPPLPLFIYLFIYLSIYPFIRSMNTRGFTARCATESRLDLINQIVRSAREERREDVFAAI